MAAHHLLNWTDDMVRTVAELRMAGANVAVIAEKIGVDPTTFRKWRQRTGGFPPISRSRGDLAGKGPPRAKSRTLQ